MIPGKVCDSFFYTIFQRGSNKTQVFKGMGGAMDLVSNPDETKIVVATEHVAKDGSSKIVQTCDLPLTGAKVVSTIITDLVSFPTPLGSMSR